MANEEECAKGARNEARIVNLENTVSEIKDCVKDLTNHYSQRLPAWATIMIIILSNIAVGLGVYFLTRR